MIRIIIASSRSIEIEDPQNFKAFSVRVEGPFDDPSLQSELLARGALSSDREQAWISENARRECSEPNHSSSIRTLIPSCGADKIPQAKSASRTGRSDRPRAVNA
jgi:hypothetical protein